MNEARITINGREANRGQSMALRVAVIAFRSTLNDPRVSSALGPMAIAYKVRMDELIALIDDTPQELGKKHESMSKRELEDILSFIQVLSNRVREEKESEPT
jgi:hypothetical protein